MKTIKIRRAFEWVESKDKDYKSWRMVSHPELDGGSGLLIAHDLLEHSGPNSFDIENEGRAFGTMIWGRGRSGRATRISNLGDLICTPDRLAWSLGDDIAEFITGCGRPVIAPPRTTPDNLLDRFYPLLKEAATEAAVEWIETRGVAYDPDCWDGDIDRFIGWINHGFWSAEQRFGNTAGMSPSDLHDIFDQVAEDDHISEPADESDKLFVEISLNLQDWRVKVYRKNWYGETY